jgi:hypothetical protein
MCRCYIHAYLTYDALLSYGYPLSADAGGAATESLGVIMVDSHWNNTALGILTVSSSTQLQEKEMIVLDCLPWGLGGYMYM